MVLLVQTAARHLSIQQQLLQTAGLQGHLMRVAQGVLVALEMAAVMAEQGLEVVQATLRAEAEAVLVDMLELVGLEEILVLLAPMGQAAAVVGAAAVV